MVFLVGDFNAVLLGSERSSGGVLDAGEVIFQQFVQVLFLLLLYCCCCFVAAGLLLLFSYLLLLAAVG